MRALTLMIALSAGTATGHATSLQVDIRFSPSVTLPGIPTQLAFTFKNETRTTLAIPRHLFLVVTPSHGTPFAANWDGPVVVTLEEFQDRRIGPGGTVTESLDSDGTFQWPGFFMDPKIASPGTYEFQAYFTNDVSQYGEGLFDGSRLGRAMRDSVASGRTVLTVKEPHGPDAPVWDAMLALGEGRWYPGLIFSVRGQQLGREIIKNHSGSEYALWFAATGIGATEQERIDNLRSMLRDRPHDALTLWRLLRIAYWEIGIAVRHGQINATEKRQHASNAANILRSILLATKDQKLRQVTNETLDRVPD